MSQDESSFSRELGYAEATAIGLGTMIGGGIFVLPSVAAANAGPASAVSFVLAGFISLPAALSHAELATAWPLSGGGYRYVNRALGTLAGSIVGWGMWIGLIFSSAFYAVGFAQYMTYFWGGISITATAIVLTAGLIALNYYGTSESGIVQDLIVVTLLVMLTAFVGGGLFESSTETLQPFNPEGWSNVVATTGIIYVALIGFSLIATVAGSIENPGRNVPLSMITAVALPTLIYVFVMLVSTGIVPADELGGSQVPLADVAAVFAGPIGALVMVFGAALATISSANASILSAGRVSYSMSEDRVLADWVTRQHDRFETPHRAVLATGVGIVALVALNVGFAVLAEIASFAFLIAYAFVHVAVVQSQRDESIEYEPSFRIPDSLYPAVPVVGVLTILGVMSQMQPLVLVGGTAVACFGILWYLLYVRWEVDKWIQQVVS